VTPRDLRGIYAGFTRDLRGIYARSAWCGQMGTRAPGGLSLQPALSGVTVRISNDEIRVCLRIKQQLWQIRQQS
jgi:hypothetical protein